MRSALPRSIKFPIEPFPTHPLAKSLPFFSYGAVVVVTAAGAAELFDADVLVALAVAVNDPVPLIV